jgi:Zn-dependent protease with chaperone function
MIALALPVVIACVAAAVVFALRRAVRPHVAVIVLTATVVATAVAATGLMVVVALVFLFDPHSTAWCEQFLGHGSHRALIPGVLVAVTAFIVVARAIRSALRSRLDAAPAMAGDLEVIASPELFAYAQPGRPGRVVVSRGMLEALSGEEQLVLFAHERAHLRHRHHRYIAVADACAAALPPLRPLATGVRFACERWADEDAASVVGERKLVARAVATAALARVETPAASFGGTRSGVPARVEAMLRPASRGRASALLIAAPAALAVAAAALQSQRLGEVLSLVL